MSKISDPVELSIQIASDFEEILGIENFPAKIKSLEIGPEGQSDNLKRDFGIGDAASIAGLFVSLVSLIIQIRAGNTFQNVPKEKITERLILKLAEQTSLPAKTRERLIEKLLNIEFDSEVDA